MSQLTKVEMSSLRHAIMHFFGRGHDSRRRHSHGTSRRIKAIPRHKKGSGGIVKQVEAADISLSSSCIGVCFLRGIAFFIASKSLVLIGGLSP
jgi:hypothetical protein